MTDGRSYLSRAIAAALRQSPRDVIEVFVAHDQDCPRLIGGECACVPDITTVTADGRRADVDVRGVAGVPRQPT